MCGNGGRNGYRPVCADRKAVSARRRPRECMSRVDDGLRDRITAELREGRSPVAIWADLVAEGVDGAPCAETIYQAVYTGVLGVKASECLRTRRPRRRSRQARRPNKRAGLPNISTRPDDVNARTEPGHWEIDQIIGAHNRSSLLTLTERVTRYAMAITMPEGYDSVATLAGLCEALDRIPAHLCKSVTLDQGSEWAEWETLAATFGIDVWFCDPHSPWQRGQIENQNRAWRFWFPRGTQLDNLDQDYVDHVAAIINGQRRRNLGDQRPTDLYTAATVQ
ncbi:MAG: IS30 family transposase [Actinobacteria bacterium]|nr:IS30 family transposase [Actinomycetota bacterium]